MRIMLDLLVMVVFLLENFVGVDLWDQPCLKNAPMQNQNNEET
jgi:hypothetical protein